MNIPCNYSTLYCRNCCFSLNNNKPQINYKEMWAKTILKANTYPFCTLFSTPSTIYALSSGVSNAISIVRVSGPEAYQVLNLLRPTPPLQKMSRDELISKYSLKPKQMTLRSIYGPEYGLIDRCLLVYFEAKHSYSGQDVFEFHLHGSRAVVSILFEELSRMNFSPAKKGEFTRRALLNKRINLQQAEAIGDLISSEREFDRQVAVNNLVGKNQDFLNGIRTQIISALTMVEAFIEFQEEEVGEGLLQKSKNKIESIHTKIKQVLQSSKQLQKAREGVKISIVGRPNVGKSTLINGLTKREMAIVSPIPGTTRDLIEGEWEVEGFRVKLVDTAGIRSSECLIEQEGIRRTKTSISQSHMLLVLFDISQTATKIEQERIVIKPHEDQILFLNHPNSIVVVNKMDTLALESKGRKVVIELQEGKLKHADALVSLKNNEEVQKIVDILGNHLKSKFDLCSKDASYIFFTRTRYIQGLQRCCQILQNSQKEIYADLLSSNLRRAMEEVEELLGRVDSEEVLDSVFSSFCIGK